MRTAHYLAAIGLLIAIAVGLQVWRDRGWAAYEPATPVMWLRAGPAMARGALGYRALLADLYWIRSVVYFGRQGLSTDPNKNYDLLHPLLDLVTTLDPRFTVAYRFGAIFLSETSPNGPGRPDLAVSLLERGVARTPERWEYMHDIGLVYYWHNRDFEKGAEWLERASLVPGAPIWLKSTAASMHSERGNRQSARQLWRQIREAAEADSLVKIADLRLAQFDAMDAIDALNDALARFRESAGRLPTGWPELVAARQLRGIPLDPAGVPYEIDAASGSVRVAERSPLWPMPPAFTATPRR
jgi:tetratricopeptide (TPR) repeat protein